MHLCSNAKDPHERLRRAAQPRERMERRAGCRRGFLRRINTFFSKRSKQQVNVGPLVGETRQAAQCFRRSLARVADPHSMRIWNTYVKPIFDNFSFFFPMTYRKWGFHYVQKIPLKRFHIFNHYQYLRYAQVRIPNTYPFRRAVVTKISIRRCFLTN